MSAKILTAEQAAAAASLQWPAAGASEPAEPQSYPGTSLAIVHQPAAPDNTKTAALEQQIERLRAESEKKIQEAAAAARREGETAARESLAANVNSEIGRLKQLTTQVLGSAPALRKQAEGDLVRLAIAIARRILHRELAVDSEALLGLTKAALSKIDQREIHKIRTHPENVPLLERVLDQGRGRGRIEISADGRLDRGALIIDTARGQLDASVETHLEEIERGFIDLVGDQG
jgi:flagellar assembly protein FliH